jgi:hypothetical protein
VIQSFIVVVTELRQPRCHISFEGDAVTLLLAIHGAVQPDHLSEIARPKLLAHCDCGFHAAGRIVRAF